MSRSKAEMLKRQARRVTAVVLMAAMLFMVIPASTLPFISARAEAGPAVSGSDILSAEETGEAPVSFSDLSVSGSDAATSGSDVNITESHPVFAQSAAANGVTVTVSAPVGVFPAGAELSVTALGAAVGGKVEKLIGADKDSDCYSFDIKVMLNGEEIQPDSAYGNVSVRFSLADIPANTDVSVYHVNDAVTSSEEMAPVVSGDSVSVSTDSFSIFVIELTHGGYYYTMAGDVAVEIGVIAKALGITGTVTAAGSSDESCLAVELGEDGYLYAVPMSAFVGEVILVIEIDGTTDYEVSVATLDVELERVAWFDYNAPGIGQPGGIMVRNSDGGTEDLYIDCGDGNIVPYTDDFVVAGKRVDIYAEGTGLSSIDARGNGYVSAIDCEGCGLNELLVSGASMLTNVNCADNDLFELDTTGCDSLGMLNCKNNDIFILDVSHLPSLYYLDCGSNPLADLNVSTNTSLMTLLCSNTNISYLDLSHMSNLNLAILANCPELIGLELGSHPILTCLSCPGGALSELDLSGCPALTELHCAENDLYDLDLSGCSDLTILSCAGNNLSDYDLDLSDCSDLTTLSCDRNDLTTLDLSACTALKNLTASGNRISSVTLGSDPAQMEEIDLSENCLTFLTLPVPGADTNFNYKDQAPIVLPASIEPGVALETLAPYDTDGTEFGWFEVGALEGDEENLYSEDAVVTFTEEDVGRAYMAGMANDKFGDTVIFTTDVTVVSDDEYCTVSFDANGGEGTMLDQVMVSGFEYILHANEFTRDYYRFEGWSTDKDSKEVAYADGAAVKDIFTSGQDTMTLYAVWAIDLLPQAVITVASPGAAFDLGVFGGSESSPVHTDFYVDFGNGEIQVGNYFNSAVTLGSTVTIYAEPGREMSQLDLSNSTGAVSVDVTAADNLHWMYITNCAIDQLVMDNPELSGLSIESCGIDSIDLTGCPNIYALYLTDNNLTSIDLSSVPDLEFVTLNDNQLTELDISGNPKLLIVEANDNLLSEIDTSACPKLDALTVNNNQISSFDFSANPDMCALHCSGNQLTSLDFSSNPDMMSLSCENNFLGFSSLLDPNKTFDNPYYYVDQDYAPQGEYKIQETVAATSILDLSSEAEPFGSPTTYKWYYADGTAVEPEYITENGGKFSFGPELDGEEIYCAMTNPLYPDLTLVTTKTQVYADSFEYLVAFDANGGEGTMDAQIFTYNVEQALSANTFTREGHTFTGWEDAEGNTYTDKQTVKNLYTDNIGTVTLYAQWEAETFTVTWQNEDGTELEVDTDVPYGTVPTYDGATPAKPSDDAKDYTFVGWTPIISEVTGDVTYTAKYTDDTREYTVTWKNGDEIIYSEDLLFGTVPAYDSAKYGVPAKESTAAEDYTFAGWDPEINIVTGTVTYAAQFTATPREYTVLWKNHDGSTLATDTVAYGKTPAYTGVTPVKDDDAQYTYTFTGWDPAIEAVTGDAVYTAQFGDKEAKKYTITFDTNGGTPVAPITQAFGTDVTAPADPTKEGYAFDGWDKEIPATMPAEDMTITAKWDANEYTITFETNGGSPVDPITQDYGTDVTAPNDPAKEGYTFVGWDKEIPATMPAQDMIITAQWEINEYTITFDTQGGTEIAPITQDYGTDVTAPNAPAKEGYTFAGWDEEIPATMPAEDMTITAQWKINEYTITFDTQGGTTIAPITQDYGTDVTAPADPTKEGYTFAGWDKEIPATMPAKNMIITAQWDPNQYTITFDTKGGSAVDPITQDFGTDVTAPTDPTKTGYTFKGWDKEIPSTMPAENVEVKAQWKANTYTVTFNADGGEVNPASKTVVYDSAYGTLPVPTKDGYEFVCWKLDDEAITADSIVRNAEDVTLTAQWRSNERAITFDTDGGSAIAPIVQDIGTAVTAPADPTKEGYTFTGWDKELPAVMPAEDMTVTAQWEANEYTVSFDANGGEGTMADQSFTYDEAQNLTANAFTKEGCEFTGWKDADGNEYTDGQSVKNLTAENGGKVTLTAQWETLPTYKVTVTATAGGTVTPSQVEAVEGEDVTFTLTPDNDRYEITSVKVNGTAVDVSKLPASGKGKALTVSDISADTAVEVTFAAEPIVGTASVNMKNGQTFYVNEDITFTAIGSWPDSATTYINGDQYYVPLNWHHADPSGDWGGKDDPSFTYSATFKQAATGKYTLKVEFQRYTHNGTTWEADGIVTIAREYTVTTRSAGTGGEVPKTGDTTMTSGTGVTIAVNAILLSIVFVVLYLRRRGRTVVFYE